MPKSHQTQPATSPSTAKRPRTRPATPVGAAKPRDKRKNSQTPHAEPKKRRKAQNNAGSAIATERRSITLGGLENVEDGSSTRLAGSPSEAETSISRADESVCGSDEDPRETTRENMLEADEPSTTAPDTDWLGEQDNVPPTQENSSAPSSLTAETSIPPASHGGDNVPPTQDNTSAPSSLTAKRAIAPALHGGDSSSASPPSYDATHSFGNPTLTIVEVAEFLSRITHVDSYLGSDSIIDSGITLYRPLQHDIPRNMHTFALYEISSGNLIALEFDKYESMITILTSSPLDNTAGNNEEIAKKIGSRVSPNLKWEVKIPDAPQGLSGEESGFFILTAVLKRMGYCKSDWEVPRALRLLCYLDCEDEENVEDEFLKWADKLPTGTSSPTTFQELRSQLDGLQAVIHDLPRVVDFYCQLWSRASDSSRFHDKELLIINGLMKTATPWWNLEHYQTKAQELVCIGVETEWKNMDRQKHEADKAVATIRGWMSLAARISDMAAKRVRQHPLETLKAEMCNQLQGLTRYL